MTDVITALGHEVFQIDTRMAGYEGITAGYLIRSDRPCLVETGTAPSAPVVADALTELGVGSQDLATIVVTHIHLITPAVWATWRRPIRTRRSSCMNGA